MFYVNPSFVPFALRNPWIAQIHALRTTYTCCSFRYFDKNGLSLANVWVASTQNVKVRVKRVQTSKEKFL